MLASRAASDGPDLPFRFRRHRPHARDAAVRLHGRHRRRPLRALRAEASTRARLRYAALSLVLLLGNGDGLGPRSRPRRALLPSVVHRPRPALFAPHLGRALVVRRVHRRGRRRARLEVPDVSERVVPAGPAAKASAHPPLRGDRHGDVSDRLHVRTPRLRARARPSRQAREPGGTVRGCLAAQRERRHPPRARPEKRFPLGTYTVILALAYSPVRFALDFLRVGEGDEGDVRYGALTFAQYACIAFFGLGLYFAWKIHASKRQWGKDEEEAVRAASSAPSSR